MTRRQVFSYVYGGAATFGGQTRSIDGTAWSLGRCDEVRLRAAAVRDLSQSEGVPLAGIEITDFWYSEVVTDDGVRDTAAGADPFRPNGVPARDTVDPFSPGHPCSGDSF